MDGFQLAINVIVLSLTQSARLSHRARDRPQEPAEHAISRPRLCSCLVWVGSRGRRTEKPRSCLKSEAASPNHRPYNSSDSGPNMESNIETPLEHIAEELPVTAMLTTVYISGASRDRTGDLWLAKLLLGPPLFSEEWRKSGENFAILTYLATGFRCFNACEHREKR